MAFESTNYTATRIDSAKASAKLQAYIANGGRSAREAFKYAMQNTIQDALIRDSAVMFSAGYHNAPRTMSMQISNPEDGSHSVLQLTDYALGLACKRYGMPTAFAKELLEHESGHVRALAAETLETLARNQPKPGRSLVRMQDGKIKAVLSDSYRRLDCRPMFESFAMECEVQGLRPVEGLVTDTRIAIKALVPRVFIAGNDAVCFGMQLKNSDFGAGAFECKIFALRLWCLNGALLETAMRQVHLGRKLDEGTFSQKTYDLDSETSISAMRDVIKGALSEGSVNEWVKFIDANAKEGFNAGAAFDQLQKTGKITKAEKLKIAETYNSPDVEMLPPGQTAWRASNAISWFAHAENTGDRKLELEKLAGDVLTAEVVS